jgi:outer membrane phospholipase A
MISPISRILMPLLTLSFVGLPVLTAAATRTWVIATPDASARAGAPIILDVFKPGAGVDWPATPRLSMELDGKTHEIELAASEPVTAEGLRRTYRGVVPLHLHGLVLTRLADTPSNRLALLVTASDAAEVPQGSARGKTEPDAKSDRASHWVTAADEPGLSINEPMYFVLGGDGEDLTARFQLSFKYRLLDPDSLPVEWYPPLAGLHFGYTQTSVWDLDSDSAPFHDTSYRPSLFWQGAFSGRGMTPALLRAGLEHESNGKDGDQSRSINTLFVQPAWYTEFADGRSLIFAPRFYGYLDKDDNPDIQRYRGYADWIFRYGHENGWLLTALLRQGTGNHGSAQLDLTYPLRRPLFARTGGFLHFQLFKGYGESLLDYDVEQDLQARVGISIVR